MNATTAALANYLIERVSTRNGQQQVNLCERQGDEWITLGRGITQETAEHFGFNLHSPAVQSVFRGTTECTHNWLGGYCDLCGATKHD